VTINNYCWFNKKLSCRRGRARDVPYVAENIAVTQSYSRSFEFIRSVRKLLLVFHSDYVCLSCSTMLVELLDVTVKNIVTSKCIG